MEYEFVERVEQTMFGTRLSVEGAARSLSVAIDTVSLRELVFELNQRGNLSRCPHCDKTWMECEAEVCDICIDEALDELEDEMDELRSRRIELELKRDTRKPV